MNPLGVKLKHAGDENNVQIISSRIYIVLVSTSGLPSGSNENIQYFYYY